MGEQKVIFILESKIQGLQDLLLILRPVGGPTGKLQKRGLDLPGALSFLNATEDDLKSIESLSPEVAA